jgi:hypothetical protein
MITSRTDTLSTHRAHLHAVPEIVGDIGSDIDPVVSPVTWVRPHARELIG